MLPGMSLDQAQDQARVGPRIIGSIVLWGSGSGDMHPLMEDCIPQDVGHPAGRVPPSSALPRALLNALL